jgi:hypothetical protein|uniref:Zinc finger C2H2-type protein n=1 Tax=Fadolivirus 2 TaxID=2740747 RepID=A0A7D3R1Z4_9VIRU|nr:zinc finger C2H2-type protein [Fadolivirus 2]
MNYECKTCNYATYDKFNYNKHLKTKKHLEKVNDANKLSLHCPKIVQELSSENEELLGE